jgi:hypothetical protein
MIEPAVRSVRVAVALADRFTELLKGPQTVSSRKQSGALVGFSGDQTGLSLRIGEAQQIYPEIWQHLDEARAAFAARNVDVSGYDAIRAEEGKGLGAAVDIKATRQGFGTHAFDEQVKSANFNRAGLARARRAVEVLMQATPEIDWAGIARAEAEDPDVVAFGRSARIKRWVSIGLLVIVLASPFVYLVHRHMKASDSHGDYVAPPTAEPMSDRDHAELAAMVTRLRTSVVAARASWAKAVAPEALAAIVPGTQPCVLPFAAPPPRAADGYIRNGDSTGLGTDTFGAYDAGGTLRDDQLAMMARKIDAVDARLSANRATAFDRKQLADLPPHFLFMIIDHETPPAVTATTPKIAFTPGAVTGRAYVYAVQSGTIVCAAKIDARNTADDTYMDAVSSVRAPQQREAAGTVLHRELEIRLRQQLAAELKSTAH